MLFSLNTRDKLIRQNPKHSGGAILKIYTLTSTQHLPISRQQAWKFLSNPSQLENITSSDLSFQPLARLPEVMEVGMIFRFQIKPFLGIRMNWHTEITHIKEGSMFIDIQRSGPFRYWQHEHRLIEKADGVEMRDTVNYAMPFSVFGEIAHRVFIRKKLEDIFEYRKQSIGNYLGKS